MLINLVNLKRYEEATARMRELMVGLMMIEKDEPRLIKLLTHQSALLATLS